MDKLAPDHGDAVGELHGCVDSMHSMDCDWGTSSVVHTAMDQEA